MRSSVRKKKELAVVVVLSLFFGVLVGWLALRLFRFETPSSSSLVTPTPFKSKTAEVVVPTVTPHNTPTPGNPRLENPTEEYRKQLLKNQEAQGLITVKIKGNRFEPAKVYLKKGGIVTWINEDETNHQIVGDSGIWGSKKVLGKNQGFSQQFDVPGSYPYHCALHPKEKGEVMVQD